MNKIKQLIEQTQAGSMEAYGELYEITVEDVYKTVRLLMGNASETDDIVQDTYLQAHRSLDKYNPTRPFHAWLIGIAMKQVQTCRRKKWKYWRLIERAQALKAIQADFSIELTDKMSHQPLIHKVDRLPFKLRQVIILHYFNQYSQEEISVLLNLPLGTVKSRIHAGLTKLRKKHLLFNSTLRKVED